MEPTTMHWIAGLPQMAAGLCVSGLWQGLVLAVVVGLCLRLMPKATPAVRFAVWTAVFAVVASLPFLHAYTGSAEHVPGARGAMVQMDVRWSFAIAGLWVILSLFRAAELVTSALRLRGIWRRAIPVRAEEALDLRLSEVGLRGVQLCTSEDVDCPSVIGFFSPRILIPVDLFERLTAPELEQIVLHELGHLRRRDDWVNVLQKLGLVLFPLNPALVWIERRLCFERELACDDDVLRWTRAPKAYAQCLTSLAELRLNRRIVSLSLGAWERQSQLSRRVHSILRRGEAMGKTQARVALSVVVLVLLGGATALSRCPGFVSFASVPEAAPISRGVAQVLPAAEYQPVTSRAMQGAPHETLLKATMPSGAASGAVVPAARVRTRRTHTPVLQRAKARRPQTPQAPQRVVLTSWSEPVESGAVGVSRVVFTVSGENFSFYATEPADGGWLVIQL
jgi:beta-lactamase regulating signal transducer with metallopeptidase domain